MQSIDFAGRLRHDVFDRRSLCMNTLTAQTALHVPALSFLDGEGFTCAVDAEAPNWVALDVRGTELLRQIAAATAQSAPLTFAALVARYATAHGLEAGKAWLHVHDFLAALSRASMLFDEPIHREPYAGRSAYIQPRGLRELWLQINNACNLTCTHCLVSSGPGGIPGLATDEIVAVIDAAAALGVERVYVTGGEPFLRADIFDITRHATETHRCEVIFLTNATLFAGRVRDGLRALDRQRVKFQVSIDGARAETNDRVRGAGTFVRALDGARILSDLGFDVSLTTVTTEENLNELPRITS